MKKSIDTTRFVKRKIRRKHIKFQARLCACLLAFAICPALLPGCGGAEGGSALSPGSSNSSGPSDSSGSSGSSDSSLSSGGEDNAAGNDTGEESGELQEEINRLIESGSEKDMIKALIYAKADELAQNAAEETQEAQAESARKASGESQNAAEAAQETAEETSQNIAEEEAQEAAGGAARSYLEALREINPDEAEVWERILEYWDEVNSGEFVRSDTLPDDLAAGGALCLVVLGYGLKSDGSMKDELIGRLECALKCANQYPDSYILVTGGPTASAASGATEAGSMAEWLRENGVSEERIIIEKKSLTTAQNALYSYEILASGYPGITDIVMISSDYHVPLGCLLFYSVFALEAAKGGGELKIVSNASHETGKSYFSVKSQADWLWSLVKGASLY